MNRHLCFSYSSLIGGLIFYCLDVGLDCFVAAKHHRNSDKNWMIVTIVFIILPGVLNGFLTLITIRPIDGPREEIFSKPMRIFGYFCSLFLLGPIYWDIRTFILLSASRKNRHKTEQKDKDGYIAPSDVKNTNDDTSTKDKKITDVAARSAAMGVVERGVEALAESIPQWTAQIYIIGLTNNISAVQLASLLSSLITAVYCVIDGSRALIKELVNATGGRGRIGKSSFALLGLWIILAMTSYGAAASLFASTVHGAIIFVLFPVFYVTTAVQFWSLVRWRHHPATFQRISIAVQVAMFIATYIMANSWRPDDTLPVEIRPKVVDETLSLTIDSKPSKDFSLGWRDKIGENHSANSTGLGRFFTSTLTINGKSQFPLDKCNRTCLHTMSLQLKISELSPTIKNGKTTRFAGQICNELIKKSDMQKPTIEILSALQEKDVFCLSKISYYVYKFLFYTNFLWLFYHIFLVISLDWIFWKKDEIMTVQDIYLNNDKEEGL